MRDTFNKFRFIGPLSVAIGALPYSTLVCHIALLVLGLVWIVDGNWKKKWKMILTNKFVWLFILFFLLHLLGITYSEDKKAAWFSVEKKISLFALPIILATISLDRRDVKFLFFTFITSCLTATIICLGISIDKAFNQSAILNFDSFDSDSYYNLSSGAASFWRFISYIDLASGIQINPSYLSFYLVFSIFLIFDLYSDSFTLLTSLKKISLLILISFLSLFIIFLSSRTWIVASLIINLYGLHLFLKTVARSAYLFTSLTFVVVLIGVIYINPVSRYRVYQEVVSTWPYTETGLQKKSTTIRASLWNLSIQSLPEINWFFGAGTGDVEHIIAKSQERAHMPNTLETSDPHNQYLETLIGLGVLGLSILLVIFVWPAWVAYKTGNSTYLGFIFLFTLLCLIESALELQKGIVFYSIFSSLILFQYKPLSTLTLQSTKV